MSIVNTTRKPLKMVMILILILCSWVYSQEQDKIKKYFKMSIHELLNAEITTAGKKAEKIADIPASIVIITRDDIESYGYQNLNEILQDVPGFYMVENYDWTDMVNFGIRGYMAEGTFDNIVFMVNGVRQSEKHYNNIILNKIAVPVEAIDRIEIVRGPMSVIYGSGAFFGAINIFTNQIEEDEASNLISASYGTRNSYRLAARVASKKKDFNYSINASIYKDGGIDVPYTKMISDTSLFGFWGFQPDETTAGRFEEKNNFFNFSGKFKGLTLDLSYVESSRDGAFSFPSIGNGSESQLTSSHIDLGYEKKITDGFTLKGKFSYYNLDWGKNYHFFNENFYGRSVLSSRGYDVELNAFIKSSNNFEVTIGLFRQTIKESENPVILPTWGIHRNHFGLAENDEIINSALFTQVDWNLFKKLKLVAGIRFEQRKSYDFVQDSPPGFVDTPTRYTFNRNDIDIIPRIGIIYFVDDKNTLKFLYGKAIKYPSVGQDADWFGSKFNNNLDIPLLEPAEIQTLELNYIANLFSKLVVNISFFRNELDNLISRSAQLDEATNTWFHWASNAGRVLTNGVEMGFKFAPLENLHMNINMIYQESKNRRKGFEDIALGYSPRLLGYAKIFYGFSKKITLGLNARYVSKMETGWVLTGGDPSEGNRTGSSVNSYFLLDGNLRIDDLFIKGLYLNLKTSNLLDKEFYYPSGQYISWADKGVIGKGRRFMVTIGKKF